MLCERVDALNALGSVASYLENRAFILINDNTSLFLAYKRHPLIAPSLCGAHLGSADEEARHWLVVDCQHQILYLAASEDVRRFLATQWPRYTAPLEYTPEEMTRLLANLEEAASPPDWAERLEEALRERRANYRLLKQWLDQHEPERG